MKTRDVVIGLIVLAVLITAVLVYKNSKNKILPKVTGPTPNYQVESKFPSLKVPTNADRANLTDVSGGRGIGEAFRTYENSLFNLTLAANLEKGDYQAWIMDKNGAKILLGKLVSEKGGYIVNFSAFKDLTSYSKVIVTLGSKNILEGSF